MTKDQEFRERVATLKTKMVISDAKLMSNPKPYLDDMAKRCNDVLELLEKVEYALSPDMVFDYWDERVDKKAIPQPMDIQGEALIRCNAALKVIREYKNS